jgi:hypothetical protein
VRALDLVLGQVAHDRQRLIARSRSVRQLNAFLVRQEALAEPEMEKKVARHGPCPVHRSGGCSMANVYFVQERKSHKTHSEQRPAHQKVILPYVAFGTLA